MFEVLRNRKWILCPLAPNGDNYAVHAALNGGIGGMFT